MNVPSIDKWTRVVGVLPLVIVGCANDPEYVLPAQGVAQGSSGSAPLASGGAPAANEGSGGDPQFGGAPGTGGAEATGGQAGGAPIGDDAGPTTSDGGDGSDASTGPVVRSTGPGDWGPGDYPPDINAQTYLEISGVDGQKGYTRQYKVHVPPSYDPNVPTPVVFCVHGLAQNAVMFCVMGTGLDKKADEEGFILVMPNGYQNSWNGGTCCGGASTEQLDDVALFRAIFDEVGTHVNIDLGRVYATGLSNGAYMSYRLACDASDLFVAVAPNAGAVGKNDIGGGTNPASDFTTCEPTTPVSVFDTHGTADGLIPYTLQALSLGHMATKDGCTMTTAAAAEPTSAGDTACVSYSGCPAGIEVTGCSVTGGGHCWFGSPDCGTGGGAIGAVFVGANSNTLVNTDAVWDFFERHTR